MVSMKQMPKPMNQPFEAGRVRTIALIFSVTVPKVCPGSMTGALRSIADLYCSGILSELQGLSRSIRFAYGTAKPCLIRTFLLPPIRTFLGLVRPLRRILVPLPAASPWSTTF